MNERQLHDRLEAIAQVLNQIATDASISNFKPEDVWELCELTDYVRGLTERFKV